MSNPNEFTPFDEHNARELHAHFTAEATSLSLQILELSQMAFKSRNIQATTIGAIACSCIEPFIRLQAATLIGKPERNKAGGIAPPSPELLLYAALVVHNFHQKKVSGKDIFELAKKQLAMLGHEIPETLAEIV